MFLWLTGLSIYCLYSKNDWVLMGRLPATWLKRSSSQTIYNLLCLPRTGTSSVSKCLNHNKGQKLLLSVHFPCLH